MSNIKVKKELILNYLKENNLTEKDFCEINNINYKTFKEVMHGEFRLHTIFKISLVLKIDLEDMFDQ